MTAKLEGHYLDPTEGWMFLEPMASRKRKREEENQELSVFGIFESLWYELRLQIIEMMDMPTRCSLSLTNRSYKELFFQPEEFDAEQIVDKCAELGYRKLIAYHISIGGRYDDHSASIAAKMGFFFEELSRSFDSKVLMHLCRDAAQEGHIQLARNLYQRVHKGKHIPPMKLIEFTAQGGNLEIARKTCTEAKCKQNLSFYRILFNSGVSRGHADLVVESLKHNPSLLTPNSIGALATQGACYGVKPFLEIAQRHGVFFESLLDKIVKSKWKSPSSHHLECLTYAYSILYPGQPLALELLHVPTWATCDELQWLKDHSCTFKVNDMVCNYLIQAETHLRLDVVQWMINHGGVIGTQTIIQAARLCRLDLLDLLWENRPASLKPDSDTLTLFIDKMICSTYASRFYYKRIRKTVDWLLTHGYQWDKKCRINGIFVNRLRIRCGEMIAKSFVIETGITLSKALSQRIVAWHRRDANNKMKS